MMQRYRPVVCTSAFIAIVSVPSCDDYFEMIMRLVSV